MPLKRFFYVAKTGKTMRNAKKKVRYFVRMSKMTKFAPRIERGQAKSIKP